MLKLAEKVIEILIQEGKEESLASPIDSESKRIPAIHNFPHSSCEVATYIYTKLLTQLEPSLEVKVVSGKCNNVTHYWALVENKIFDLTHHQFPNISSPILNAPMHSVSGLEGSSTVDADSAFEKWDQMHKYDWLEFVKEKI